MSILQTFRFVRSAGIELPKIRGLAADHRIIRRGWIADYCKLASGMSPADLLEAQQNKANKVADANNETIIN